LASINKPIRGPAIHQKKYSFTAKRASIAGVNACTSCIGNTWYANAKTKPAPRNESMMSPIVLIEIKSETTIRRNIKYATIEKETNNATPEASEVSAGELGKYFIKGNIIYNASPA